MRTRKRGSAAVKPAVAVLVGVAALLSACSARGEGGAAANGVSSAVTSVPSSPARLAPLYRETLESAGNPVRELVYGDAMEFEHNGVRVAVAVSEPSRLTEIPPKMNLGGSGACGEIWSSEIRVQARADDTSWARWDSALGMFDLIEYYDTEHRGPEEISTVDDAEVSGPDSLISALSKQAPVAKPPAFDVAFQGKIYGSQCHWGDDGRSVGVGHPPVSVEWRLPLPFLGEDGERDRRTIARWRDRPA